MPWGHPGEHHDFEPQRHDDGYLEVIGFTMTSLVSGLAQACLQPPFCFVQCPARLQDGSGCHQTSLVWLGTRCLLLSLTESICQPLCVCGTLIHPLWLDNRLIASVWLLPLPPLSTGVSPSLHSLLGSLPVSSLARASPGRSRAGDSIMLPRPLT